MYKKLKASQIPKRQRKQPSRFEGTKEWRLMKADLDRGLSPQEALQITLTDEDKKKYNIKNRRTIARFIKKYLESQGLNKYQVRNFRTPEGDTIIVSYIPVIRQTA